MGPQNPNKQWEYELYEFNENELQDEHSKSNQLDNFMVDNEELEIDEFKQIKKLIDYEIKHHFDSQQQ